ARRPRTVHFGATCNLAIRRELWERAGPFPENLDGGEDTLLTVALRRRGLFAFVPDAPVDHLNRTRWIPFLHHQHGFGRFTARLAHMDGVNAAGPVRAALTRYAALAPVAVLLRIAWVYGRVATLDRSQLPAALRCAPALAAGSIAWGVGLVAEHLSARRRGVGDRD
ncbi:MAG TPA: hypothetical protein VHJ78_08720, partial [Actinomycetota bacterium]|nr:hypothetical protein [Actinomycetota bacterium]